MHVLHYDVNNESLQLSLRVKQIHSRRMHRMCVKTMLKRDQTAYNSGLYPGPPHPTPPALTPPLQLFITYIYMYMYMYVAGDV